MGSVRVLTAGVTIKRIETDPPPKNKELLDSFDHAGGWTRRKQAAYLTDEGAV